MEDKVKSSNGTTTGFFNEEDVYQTPHEASGRVTSRANITQSGFECQGICRLSALRSPLAHLCESSIQEAHCRLGHPSLLVLKQPRPDFSSFHEFTCELCQLGKHLLSLSL